MGKRGVSSRTTFAALAMLALAACSSPPDDPQRLMATGQLLDGVDGTPIADQLIQRYNLTFVVATPSGNHDVLRTFTHDVGDPIRTDAEGRFRVTSPALDLSYVWEEDQLVCGDVCVGWDTVCDTVSEEVCLDTCQQEECWDECWDDCTTECWDEVECDGSGDCWTVTVCDDQCTEICETVCDTVTYGCNCYTDTYDVCGDECVEFSQECDWVTYAHTSDANLEDVIDTHTRLWTSTESGTQEVDGELIEAQQHEGCHAGGECGPINLWLQKDRFTLLAPTP